MASPIQFELRRQAPGGAARLGLLRTRHADIPTPVFMPVGTMACVKSLDSVDLHDLGARIILNNAYHLSLRPGIDLVRQLGGLHGLMRYDGAILTDSGGFQIFSLSGLRTISDAGVIFRSHLDGRLIDLSPESLVTVQEALAPDIAMVLDECPPGQASREVVTAAVTRTTAWAQRNVAARRSDGIAWFGIVQGGCYDDLRAEHARAMTALPFDGYAIGGVSVGEAPADIDRVVRLTAPLLPADKPRYLMGVGTPADLVRGVDAGVDMFDCVMPSRNARNGQLFTSGGRVSIKNAAWRAADVPLDAACPCATCARYSRAYLRHLYTCRELTYHRLASRHNLTFYLGLMARMRADLAADSFSATRYLAEPGLQ